MDDPAPSPGPASSQPLGYARPVADDTARSLAPLVVGLILTITGIITLLTTLALVSGAPSGRSHQTDETAFMVTAAVVVAGLGLLCCGLLVLFNGLRRYA